MNFDVQQLFETLAIVGTLAKVYTSINVDIAQLKTRIESLERLLVGHVVIGADKLRNESSL